MTIRTAVVPVAGWGKRLYPLTKSIPKVMLPLGKRPVLDYVIREMKDAGISRVIFITGHGESVIKHYYENSRAPHETMDYHFIHQSEKRGPGHAVFLAREIVREEPFVVAFGDAVFHQPGKVNMLREMIHVFKERKASAVVAVQKVKREEVRSRGIVEIRDEGNGNIFRIKNLVEKPSPEQTQSRLAIQARYVFSPEIFDVLHSCMPIEKERELNLTHPMNQIVSMGMTVYARVMGIEERRFDIGRFETYFKAFQFFAEKGE